MGERTDELGDYDRSPYGAGGPIPPNDQTDEPLYVERADLEEHILVVGSDTEKVDVTDRDAQLAARAESSRDSTLDTTHRATSDAAIGAAMGAASTSGTVDESDTSETSDDPDQIRDGIESTRAEMSQTIDEIQERLSPQRLAQQATDAVRDATIGRAGQMMSDARDTAQNAGQSLWTTIRENPIPAALAGLGLGWLLYKTWDNMPSSQPRSRGGYGVDGAYGYRGYNAYDPRYGDRYVTGPDGMMYRPPANGSIPHADTGRSMTDRVQQKAGEMTDQVTDKAQQLASQAQDTAGEWMDQAQDTAGQWADQAQYQAQRAQGWVQRSWDENPLAMGALALAAGAVIGLSIPETDRENQLMGSARDSFMDKAQDTVQKAQTVAQRAAGAATEAAKSAAQDEAQKQGLTQGSSNS